MTFINFLFAAWLVFPTAALADPAFSQAQAVFLKAVEGDGGAVDEAFARFEKLAEADSPAAPLFQAYLGATQTLRGREAWLPWEKVRATERGLTLIEKALRRLEPRHDTETLNGVAVALDTRLVAVTTCFAVPAFFNRFDMGKQVLREAMAHPGFAGAPPEVRARLYQQAALAASRDGNYREEREYLKKAAELAQSPKTVEAVSERLRELRI